MLKKIIFIMVFLALTVSVASAKALVVDASSPQALERSLQRMSVSISKEDGARLMKAFMLITSSIDIGKAVSADEARAEGMRILKEKIDGKTFKEIVAMTKNMPEDPRIQKAVDDFNKIGTSTDFQHDADIVRLKHLKYLGGIIEEYRDKTGEYPLVDNSVIQNYVFIASSQQQKYVQGGPSFEHKKTDMESFKKILEKGLGRKIALPFDPQLVAVNKPNFYIYMAHEKRYFLGVHLFDGEVIGRKLGPYYYKVEISNIAIPAQKVFSYDGLMKDREFSRRIKAKYIMKPPKNPEQAEIKL